MPQAHLPGQRRLCGFSPWALCVRRALPEMAAGEVVLGLGSLAGVREGSSENPHSSFRCSRPQP